MTEPTDEELTAIYLEANPYSHSIHIQSSLRSDIFRAMRLAMEKVRKEDRVKLAKHFDSLPSREMFGGTVASEIMDYKLSDDISDCGLGY